LISQSVSETKQSSKVTPQSTFSEKLREVSEKLTENGAFPDQKLNSKRSAHETEYEAITTMFGTVELKINIATRASKLNCHNNEKELQN
jgi:hypothetical protein